MDLDTLWQIEDEFQRAPQWSTTASPRKSKTKAATVVPEARRIESGRATLQVMSSDGWDSISSDSEQISNAASGQSMPGLVRASSGSDIGGAIWEEEEEAESSDAEGEESSEYDSEEEAELRDLLRQAMDIASADPEIFEEKKAFEERSNDNQFLKALGALRGKRRRHSCDEND